jgi:hypothetical protein
MRCLVHIGLVVALAGVWPSPARAGVSPDVGRAVLIYKLTKFVVWPDDAFASRSSSIHACVSGAGSEDVVKLLAQGTKGKKSQGRAIRVSQVDDDSLATGKTRCHLLYVTGATRQGVAGFRRAIERGGMLVVTDSRAPLSVGAMVAMVIEGERLRFYVNLEALEESGIRIRATLMRFAKIEVSS